MAISVDSVAESRKLAAAEQITFPLLADPKMSVIRAYGVSDEENGIAWPAIYLIGRDGRAAWRSLAQSYRMRATPAEILSAVDGLR